MAFTNAVHWWQEWQMRVLVLGSLFVYFSLYFADKVRKSPSLGKLRFLVWLAYVGGDSLATYSLGTLFNRQRQRTACGSRGSSDLEVMWAPVLLIHLGGQPTMTAYSLEDNELWKRHAMTLVSQVSVALYVFCNWWSGERRLLNAAVLLFVVGIIKFSYKPWALKRASFTSMLASSALSLQREKGMEKPIGRLWRQCTTYLGDLSPYFFLVSIPAVFRRNQRRGTAEAAAAENSTPPGEIKVEEIQDGREIEVLEERVTSLGGFVSVARRYYDESQKRETFTEGYVFAPVFLMYKMFLDLADPYSQRLKELRFFLGFRDRHSYRIIQQSLYNTFEIVYTRRRVTFTFLGAFLQASLPFLTLTSVIIFHKSHKGGYDVNDVWVTYILFGVTALHEFLPFVPSRLRGKWHEIVYQVSLLSFCGRQEKPTWVMELATIGSQKENVNKYCSVKREEAQGRRVTELVRQHVKEGWQSYIRGPISYRRFNNLRGQWTLERHKMEGNGDVDWGVLELSLAMPFHESVLVWHVATDLCYYKTLEAPQHIGAREPTQDHPGYLARVISRYMAYLLLIRSEMLLPGARAGLFNIVSDDITAMLKKAKSSERPQGFSNEMATTLRVVRLMWSSDPDESFEVSSLVFQVKNLTDQLEKLGEERWKVILGVWVEMLCFSAARCSGYLRVRSLGDGGEFLSYIWLLWSVMGMETLADKISKPEPTGEEQRKKEVQEEDTKQEGETSKQENEDDYTAVDISLS